MTSSVSSFMKQALTVQDVSDTVDQYQTDLACHDDDLPVKRWFNVLDLAENPTLSQQYYRFTPQQIQYRCCWTDSPHYIRRTCT